MLKLEDIYSNITKAGTVIAGGISICASGPVAAFAAGVGAGLLIWG